MMSDASGNIYLGAEGPSPSTNLIAFDKSGGQTWKVSTGATEMPKPVGFDPQGRMYVTVSERIVSLAQ